jgi:hypothetical protein
MAAIFLQKEAQEPLKNQKSLRSPSAFGHEVWEVDIWMISSFSCLWRQTSALGLHLVMETEKERSVTMAAIFPQKEAQEPLKNQNMKTGSLDFFHHRQWQPFSFSFGQEY